MREQDNSHANLVFIASDFAPMLGGIAQYMYDVISELPPQRVQAIALPTPGWEPFDQQQPFPIHRLRIPRRWAGSTTHLKWMMPYYFRELNAISDIGMTVCCHGNHTIMAAARLLRLVRRVPYAVFLHGYDILGARKRRVWPYYKRLLRAADIVFPNGRITRQAALSAGVNPDKLHVIHPCVNLAHLKVKRTPEQLRRELGLTNKYVILTVGRLVKRKGIDVVIQALPQILTAVPETHYVVVGDGPDRLRLTQLADNYQVSNHITFIGAKTHQEVADYFAMSDVFVMTTHEYTATGDIESFGIVYLEANLLGSPVVASHAGGVEDAVIHEKTGLLIEPDQPAELAQVIIRLQRDPVLSKELADYGRQRILAEFTSAAAARRFLNALPSHVQ